VEEINVQFWLEERIDAVYSICAVIPLTGNMDKHGWIS
jgi:hypothetical protein